MLWKVALFGAMWGVGNVSYGLTMRHLGMSLGIGVAIGVTLVVGTLMPPLLHGQAAMLFQTRGGLFNMAGVLVALIGVAIVSYAGHQKEEQLKTGEPTEFNVKLGLGLAVMCGMFSSGMSFAMDAAQPIKQAAENLGVNHLYSALPGYVFIMGGGALVNLSYCFIRLAVVKKISLQHDLAQPRGHAGEECHSGGYGRNHVVLAVLLLRMGPGQHSAAAELRELDAAHERLCAVRRPRRAGAGRVGWRDEPAGPAAVGRDAGHYRGCEPGGAGAGILMSSEHVSKETPAFPQWLQGWVIAPFVLSIPRESLEFTSRSTATRCGSSPRSQNRDLGYTIVEISRWSDSGGGRGTKRLRSPCACRSR